ncbi:MAG TPA: amino acid permease [Candidatus Bathyarchaeia archaeon]|nr:amino acid permease [Candidatus Bathyarchaeia archaeon]
MSEEKPSLRKAVTMRYAVALYMSSVLGSGVLVLPGLAAQIAGPASLLAWVLLSIASYPLAYTFASLSARKPESGGVYSFAREAFGLEMADAVGWLFIVWYVTGAPVVTVIAASYLSYAIPLSKTMIYGVAALIILGAFLINYRGIVVSGKVQLAVIVAIIGLLLTAVIASAPIIRLENFSPIFPYGIIPIGTAAALIFWSYLGYENVSNVAEEFKNPERDFHRSIVLSVFVIGSLYLSVAIATVGTQAYKAGGSIAPFAAILSNALGVYGGISTAVLAVFIIFGTVNAYTTGMSRVIYSVAKEGGLPKAIARIHPKTRVPHLSLALLSGFSLITLVLSYFLDLDLQTALLIPSGAAILVYVIGSASGIRLLKGSRLRLYPWISLAISVFMLPFVGVVLVVSALVALFGYNYRIIRGFAPINTKT